MDPILLSRLQFALATFFHFLYVPLTIGLSVFIAIMETRYVRTNNEMYKQQAKFWGKIFLINFALGVVTGLTLEFQFGTNWSKYSSYMGDIFGSLLAIEATVAFFLESTFLAVWAFGWNRLSKKMHVTCMWLVAAAGTTSALWILLANGFMQNPVPGSYIMDPEKNRVILGSFIKVLTNPYGWGMFFHTVIGAMLLAGFFTLGISAWKIFRKQNVEFFHASFKLATVFCLVFATISIFSGHTMGRITAKYQPAKFAALESVWETQEAAPMHILVIPPFSKESEENIVEALPVPGMLSYLATSHFSGENSKVVGLKDIPKDERPLVWPVFFSFRLMVALGFAFFGLAILAFAMRRVIVDPFYRYVALFFFLCIPLPYLAMELGWIVTEMGRQPWIIKGLLKTKDAVSPIDWYQVASTLGVMGGIYTLLTLLGITLMGKVVSKGPSPDLTTEY